MNEIKSMSAVKKYPRAKKLRGGENVHWQRIQQHGQELAKVLRVSNEIQSVITRLVLFKHLTALQGEAAKRYAYIMARYEKYSTEGRRSARSPSYERAFGQDQELERLHNTPDGLATYERRAKEAGKDYRRLQRVLASYEDRATGRNMAKNVLDDLCCSDIEPASEYRRNCAVVLQAVAEKFGVTVTPRKNNRRGRK